MNKLKVAVQELRDYLGSDAQGKALLDEITVIANEQRKRCVSLDEAAATSKATAERLRTALDTAQLRLDVLRAECDRETARRMAAETRERAAREQLAALQESGERDEQPADVVGRRRAIEKLIDRVRRRYRVLPSQCGTQAKVYVEDLVRSFTSDEFMGLGMVVATCVFMGMPLPLTTDKPASKLDDWDEEYTAKFVYWYRRLIHFNEAHNVIQARFDPAGVNP